MLQDQDLLSIQEVRTKVERAYAAAQKFRTYSQEQVDTIVEAMGEAARANAWPLAEMAVEETGMGNAKSKLAKNLLNADLLVRSIRGMKSVGIIREVPEKKLIEIATPVGVVAAILPTTNPTSTVIYKSIISVKAGNAVVISPHPRAKRCTCATADIVYQAALAAGAPEDLIVCINNPTIEATNALMRHEKTGVILATGGSGIVKAAYSSGNPAFGVGPGNVPVLLDESADLPEAIRKVVEGKSFDYGTVCSSEQTLVAVSSLRDPVLRELQARHAYLCNEAETAALAKILLTSRGAINPDCVGQAPGKIASMAGFSVPPETSILVVEIKGVGKLHPLSAEKLSPVLSVYFVRDFEACLEACESILHFGGLGHTCVIYAKDDARIRQYGLRMPAFRVLVNTPSPQGSTGITTSVQPAMTLGCGAIAGNVTSDNVGPQHLFNIKRVAYEIRRPEEALSIPDTPSAARPLPSSPPITRQNVVSAVEKYLAQRGLHSAAPSPSPAPPPVAAAVIPKPAPHVSALVVDRFLQSRHTATPTPASAPTCGCSTNPKPSQPPETPKEQAPPITVVDFVCESDVRTAIRDSRKIYIGPKTIVTPAARELAAAKDTLVVAQRS